MMLVVGTSFLGMGLEIGGSRNCGVRAGSHRVQ
jgi:hypothetical protein